MSTAFVPTPPPAASQVLSDAEQAQALLGVQRQLCHAIQQRVVGQQAVVEHLLIVLFAGGHALLMGAPGLAKTLLIHTLAQSLALQFQRIQFTPDMMPADITGSDVLDQDAQGKRHFRFVHGPVFCNLLLADEINRTPPKTQAALLQAMQERQVSYGGQTQVLPVPFHVFATQNPLEQQGTYPLPEAQLDRFMMLLQMDYPSADEEVAMLRAASTPPATLVEKVLQPAALVAYQNLIRRVPVAEHVLQHAVNLVRATRPSDATASSEVRQFVSYGAGPRASQHLLQAAQARALLQGRAVVDRADIETLALPVLQHRLVLNFQATAQQLSAATLIAHLVHAQAH